jgi:hypothetical protein
MSALSRATIGPAAYRHGGGDPICKRPGADFCDDRAGSGTPTGLSTRSHVNGVNPPGYAGDGGVRLPTRLPASVVLNALAKLNRREVRAQIGIVARAHFRVYVACSFTAPQEVGGGFGSAVVWRHRPWKIGQTTVANG